MGLMDRYVLVRASALRFWAAANVTGTRAGAMTGPRNPSLSDIYLTFPAGFERIFLTVAWSH